MRESAVGVGHTVDGIVALKYFSLIQISERLVNQLQVSSSNVVPQAQLMYMA